MNEREQIQFLAALLRCQHNYQLTMRECLNMAEGALAEAVIVDSEVQRELDQQEKAAQPPAPLTDKLQ